MQPAQTLDSNEIEKVISLTGKERRMANLRKGKKPSVGEIIRKDELAQEIENVEVSVLGEEKSRFHFKNVRASLDSKKDYDFYVDRWNAYIKEYPDLDPASDLDDLHLMIMEMIFQRRLMEDKKNNNTRDIMKEWDASNARYSKLKSNLATTRDKRISTGRNLTDNNLANLIASFDKNKKEELKKREQEFRQEEIIELENKAKRDLNLLEASGLDKVLAAPQTVGLTNGET